MRSLLWLLLAPLAPAVLAAQTDVVARGEVAGIVYDSIARRPVAGADVELVLAASPGTQLHVVQSDARGRFVATNLPPGRYMAAFQHAILDTLGVRLPVRYVDVRAGEQSRLDLAVPSGPTLVRAICGATGGADSTGVLFGTLTNARTRATSAGTVRVWWQEFIFATGGMRIVERDTSAPAAEDGWFHVCGVPGGVDVAVVASDGRGDSTGVVAASVPVDGLTRRDLLLGGVTQLRGVVTTEKGRPLPNARVEIVGRDRIAVTDTTGAFTLADIPAGTQMLEARAIGYAREHVPLTLRDGADTTLTLTLTTLKRVLDTIRVVARRAYDRDSDGFQRRRRAGIGHFVDGEMIQRQRAQDMMHVLRTLPSIRVIYAGTTRRLMMRSNLGGVCTPAVFLDGMRMAAELFGDWDMFVHPSYVEGVEIYRSAVEVPPQFRGFSDCGSIVIWTRPQPRR